MELHLTYFEFQNTKYYLLPCDQGLLIFDAGWPRALHGFARALKTTGFSIDQIKWAIVSHFHLDHAGLVRDFQDRGINCLVFENQLDSIDAMETLIAKKFKEYQPIKREELIFLKTKESHSFLSTIGIRGEVIPTPGHSDDSVSLVTDMGEALIGDLYPLAQIMEDDVKSHASWRAILERGGKYIYPSHAEAFEQGAEW